MSACRTQYRGLHIQGWLSDRVPGTRETPPEWPHCSAWWIAHVEPDTDILEAMAACPERIARGFLSVTGRLPTCVEQWIENKFGDDIEEQLEQEQ